MASVKGMRTGGRNRKPVGLHVLQATFRQHRHGHQAPAPEAPGGIPAMPDGLSGAARKEWVRLVEHLQALGTVSRVDGLVLEHYSRLAGDAARLQADADALPRTWFEKVSVDGAGVEHQEPKLHPVFAQLRAYRMALKGLLVEMGLTPASRSRVTTHAATAAVATRDPKKARYLDGLATK